MKGVDVGVVNRFLEGCKKRRNSPEAKVAQTAQFLMMASPMADVEPVIRCEGCKYYKQNEYNQDKYCDLMSWDCDEHTAGFYRIMKPDDFCSYGEPIEEAKHDPKSRFLIWL